ncbi:hypothetical protein AB0H12_35250 [Actinosynnema sp. NPDC023794]
MSGALAWWWRDPVDLNTVVAPQAEPPAVATATTFTTPPATTPVDVDVVGPVVTAPTLSGTTLSQVWNGQACGGRPTTIDISVQVSDRSGVADVVLEGTIAGGTRTWVMQPSGNATWKTRISYDIDHHTGKSGPVTLTATAADRSGNTTKRQVGQVHLSSRTPS